MSFLWLISLSSYGYLQTLSTIVIILKVLNLLLRLELSHLREHKFKHSFQDTINLLCNSGLHKESTEHFPLRRSQFVNKRCTLVSLRCEMSTPVSKILRGLDKLLVRCRSGALGRTKPLNHPIFWARICCLVKNKKLLGLKVFSRIGRTMKKLHWIPKYYHEHQSTCNILIKFTYLMVSKLLYLIMDWETFD